MSRDFLRTKTFAIEAANFILQCARQAFDARGEFRVALSGGNTPRAVYSEMAECDVLWENFQLVFSDERCMPPDDEQSNFRTANKAPFQSASVPESSIMRMRFPLIFVARAVCFLIGANKDPKLIERVFSGDVTLPAAHVGENAKHVTWIIDQNS